MAQWACVDSDLVKFFILSQYRLQCKHHILRYLTHLISFILGKTMEQDNFEDKFNCQSFSSDKIS